MNLLTRATNTAKHRGKTPTELKAEIRDLKAKNAALDRLTEDLSCRLAQQVSENKDLRTENNTLQEQVDTAAIDLSGALEDLRVERADNLRYRVAEQNANRVSIPASGHREVEEGNEVTQPIPIPVVQRFVAGPVVTLAAKAVTDPGQTSWGRDRETAEEVA